MASLKYIDISSSDSDDSGFQVEMDKYLYTDESSRRRTASINDGVTQSQATLSCPNSARSNTSNGRTMPPTLMPLNPGKHFSNPSNGRLLPLTLMPPLIPGKQFSNPSNGRTLPPILMTIPYVGFKDDSDQTGVGDISSSGSGDSDICEVVRKDIEESSFGHTASSMNDEIAQSKASSSCPNSAQSNPSKVENCNLKSESRELPQIAKSDKYDGRVDDNKESKHERDTNSEPKGNEKLDNDGYSGSNSHSNLKDVKEQHCLKQYPDIPGGNAETWQSSRGSLHGPANAGEESLYVDDKVFAEAREAVGENKINAKGDDKLKDKDRKWKEGKHWDWGERDKQSFERTKEIIKETVQQWKKLKNGNDRNEKKNVGKEDRESDKWGREKEDPQKEKEKNNKKDNVKELRSGSDKEAPHIEKELVEIPGKSSEHGNSTLEPKKKEHDKTRKAVGENKIDAKGDDKLKDKDSKWKDGKHWDWGDRDKQSFDRTKEIIKEAIQQWKKLRNGNNINEKKNVGFKDGKSEKWGCEKKEPQKEKEKLNENVKELWSGSDKEAPHIEKEQVEIPGKSSEQENCTLELKKKEHDKTCEAVGENKIDAKGDDKLKDKDSKRKDGKHCDWGNRDKQSFYRTKEIIKESIQQWKKLKNDNNSNENKNVGKEDRESEKWGCEKKEPQKEKEKLYEKDNVEELWSGSDKEVPHIKKEQVEIPGKSSEQENSTLELKKKEHDKTCEAVGKNKIDAKGDDELKDKDSKQIEGKHWDRGKRDKESFDIIKETIQQWKKLKNGNNSNENKNVGKEDRESEKWGCEKKEPQKEKEKFNEKDNVTELWSGSDKEASHIEKELVEIPGKSSEQENSTLKTKEKEHDNGMNAERKGRDKKNERDAELEPERPDKHIRYQEKELEDSVHVEGGTEREREVFSCGVQQRKRMLRPRGSPQLGNRDSRFRSGANDNQGSQGKAGVSCVVYRIGKCMQELMKLWKEYESSQADKGCDGTQDGPTLEICIPAEHVSATNCQVRGGQLWGTDVYTVDSDLVAVLMHVGYCRLTASPPPSATQELRATIRVLPPQDCYISTLRNNVRSRAWGAVIGCSYCVEGCCIVKKGGGIVVLESCLTHSSTVDPTLAPVAVEQAMTTRATASNALHQQRFVREVTIQFNLCMEPWMKYSLSAVADKGLKKSLFTSARLKKGEVLYVETHFRRYELCFNGEKVVKSTTASHAHGSETGQPQTSNAHSSNGERSVVDGESTVMDIFRWSRCKHPLPQKSMQSIGIPLPVEHVEVLEDNLEWEEISWSQTGAWIGGREYHLARAHFLIPKLGRV